MEGGPVRAGVSEVSKRIALQAPAPMQSAVFHTSHLSMYGLASLLFDGVSGLSVTGALSFQLAQVQELLHEVVAKLEVILKEPGDGAETHLSRALNYLERSNWREAYSSFKNSQQKAVQAFSIARNDSDVPMLCAATQLLLLSDIYIEAYCSNKEEFVPLEQLNESQKRNVCSVVRVSMEKFRDAISKTEGKGVFTSKKDFEEMRIKKENYVLRQSLPILLRLHHNRDTMDKKEAKQTNNDKEVNVLKGFENSMVGKKETLTLEVELVPQDIRDGVSYALGLPDSEVPFLLPTSLQIPQLIPRPSSLLRSDSISVNHPITLIWREGFTLHLFLGNMVYAVRCLNETGQILINFNSTSVVPFHHEGQPLPCQPISKYLDGSVLEDCIRRLNENAFNLLLPCLPGEPDLLRLCSLASKYGLASCLDRLLSMKGSSSVDMVTPLRRASINGRNSCLEVVVRHRGPEVLTKGFHSCSPLEMAVEGGHLATVRLLVRLGSKEVVEQASRAEMDRMDRIMPKEVSLLAGKLINPGHQKREVREWLRDWRQEHLGEGTGILGPERSIVCMGLPTNIPRSKSPQKTMRSISCSSHCTWDEAFRVQFGTKQERTRRRSECNECSRQESVVVSGTRHVLDPARKPLEHCSCTGTICSCNGDTCTKL